MSKIKTVAIALLLLAARLASAEDPQISSFAELQQAVNVASAYGKVTVSETIYVRDAPLNMRGRIGLRLRFVGEGKLVVRYRPADASHWPVIDATGAQYVEFDHLRIQVPLDFPGVRPGCGVLFARLPNPNDPDRPRSAAENLVSEAKIGGSYEQACIYNVGSELLRIDGKELRNSFGACYMTSSWNVAGIRSPHGPIAGGPEIGGPGKVCNAVHWLENTHFRVSGHKPCIVQYPAGGFLNLTNCSFSVQGTAPCAIYIGHRTGWSETPIACWGGLMIGNYAEHGKWYTPDVVFATVFKDLGSTRGREGYPDLLKLNPGFRHGVMHIDCLMKDFPHP